MHRHVDFRSVQARFLLPWLPICSCVIYLGVLKGNRLAQSGTWVCFRLDGPPPVNFSRLTVIRCPNLFVYSQHETTTANDRLPRVGHDTACTMSTGSTLPRCDCPVFPAVFFVSTGVSLMKLAVNAGRDDTFGPEPRSTNLLGSSEAARNESGAIACKPLTRFVCRCGVVLRPRRCRVHIHATNPTLSPKNNIAQSVQRHCASCMIVTCLCYYFVCAQTRGKQNSQSSASCTAPFIPRITSPDMHFTWTSHCKALT